MPRLPLLALIHNEVPGQGSRGVQVQSAGSSVVATLNAARVGQLAAPVSRSVPGQSTVGLGQVTTVHAMIVPADSKPVVLTRAAISAAPSSTSTLARAEALLAINHVSPVVKLA